MIHATSFTNTILPSHVRIGKYTSIAENCDFMIQGTHLAEVNHKCVFTINWEQPSFDKTITIGNDVWIGRGVKFFDGITVGNGAIVGAYTVVHKNVPPYAVVIGNRMRIIRMRFTLEQIMKLEKMRWWDWPNDLVISRREDMKDIDKFLDLYGKDIT